MEPKLDETIYVDFITSAADGSAADADSLPTAEVFENATDTTVAALTVTKRTSKTGNYRLPIACTTANGFEVDKSYNVVASATVGGVAAKAVVARFQVRAVLPDVNVTKVGGQDATATDGAIDANVVSVNGTTFEGDSVPAEATVDLGSNAPAGWINAAAIASDAITAAKVASDAVTEIQLGLSRPGTAQTIDLTQALTDTKAATVGGALHGAWTGTWGKAAKNVAAKTMKLFGIGSQSVAAVTFTLDDGDNPTSRTPQ